jgi:glycosyltransferase involved in cell wall biosynthesis
MKIFYFCLDINKQGGGNRVIFEHANRLANRGHSVEIWSIERPRGSTFYCKVPVFHYDGSRFPSLSDIAVVTEVFFAQAIFDKKLARKYFFLAQHDLELIAGFGGFKEIAETARNFYQNLSAEWEIISVSSWVQKRLEDQYGKKSIPISNGIDSNLFHPDKPLLNKSVPAVLYCYDDQNWKGSDDAGAAISLVKQHFSDLRVTMISALFPKIALYVDGKFQDVTGFAWPTIYINRPDQRDLASIYSSADVFISSSWSEGFGLPGLEAMACGVPVVTTDSGGVREYAIPEETAIVVPPKNPQALAEGILRVLQDGKLRQKLIKNGLEKVKEFDWEKSIDKLEKLFLKEINCQ